MTGTETEAAKQVGEHGSGTFDPGASILHHVLDSHEIEVPFTQLKIHLPVLHLPEALGGLDISITKHVVMMWLASAILFGAFVIAARRRAEPVPRGLRNVLEVMMVFLRDEVARKAIPHGSDRFVGYLMSTFFFILSCNVLGLIPGTATATGNISVTASLAVIAFLVIHVGGIRENGLLGHVKNLVPSGLPAWLVPVMFVLELLTTFIRPFALCIRLFANMMAGHIVILAFVSLIFILGWAVAPVAVAFTLFVYTLEVMVALLQAYIFTMLTAQFIGMSVHPAH